eukprot:scaffold14578_cov25-Tisochrysis_lutea.AAC.1
MADVLPMAGESAVGSELFHTLGAIHASRAVAHREKIENALSAAAALIEIDFVIPSAMGAGAGEDAETQRFHTSYRPPPLSRSLPLLFPQQWEQVGEDEASQRSHVYSPPPLARSFPLPFHRVPAPFLCIPPAPLPPPPGSPVPTR